MKIIVILIISFLQFQNLNAQKQEGEFEIFDSQGNSLTKVSIVPQKHRYIIDVSEWANGIYVIMSRINREPTLPHKFIKI